MSDQKAEKISAVAFAHADGVPLGYDIIFPAGPVVTVLPDQAREIRDVLDAVLSEAASTNTEEG